MTIKGYRFYYRQVTDPVSDWITATQDVQENPDYQFTGLSSGTEYELGVVAVDWANNESEMGTITVSTPVHTPADDPLSTSDATAVDAIMAMRGNAAGSLISTRGPKGNYSKAYGGSYSGDLTVDHKMRYGSITKMYTALLICRQIDFGHLSLDDTLEQFEPGIKYSDIITVRDLLRQTSGVPSYLDYGSGMQNGINMILHPTSVCNGLAMVHGVADTASLFYPGTAMAYSNSNYYLLGRILEVVDATYGSGRKIHVILREDCFDALGLENTEWPEPNSPDGYVLSAPMSRGWMDNPAYATIVQTIMSLPLYWLLAGIYWALAPSLTGGWPLTQTFEWTAANTEWAGASGCLGGTIDDLRDFGLALARGDLLSEEMRRRRREEFVTYTRYTPAEAYQGPGWMGSGLGLFSYGKWFGWIGSWAGFGSAMFYNEETQACIAVTINWFDGLKPWDMMMRLIYQLYPETLVLPDWTLRQESAGPAATAQFGTGRVYNWHAPGDENGLVSLPHGVPSYL